MEVAYESGLPETYQLAFTIMQDEAAKNIAEEYTQAIVARIITPGREGALCDAFYTPAFQQFLFRKLAGSENVALQKDRLLFNGNSNLKVLLEKEARRYCKNAQV